MTEITFTPNIKNFVKEIDRAGKSLFILRSNAMLGNDPDLSKMLDILKKSFGNNEVLVLDANWAAVMEPNEEVMKQFGYQKIGK
jgi:hypothetical protein